MSIGKIETSGMQFPEAIAPFLLHVGDMEKMSSQEISTLIDRVEAIYIKRGAERVEHVQLGYDMAIQRSTAKLKEKILAAKSDPQHSSKMVSIAVKGFSDLDAICQALLQDRQVTQEVRLASSSQFAQINSVLAAPLPQRSEGDKVLFKTGLIVGFAGLGTAALILPDLLRAGGAQCVYDALLEKVGEAQARLAGAKEFTQKLRVEHGIECAKNTLGTGSARSASAAEPALQLAKEREFKCARALQDARAAVAKQGARVAQQQGVKAVIGAVLGGPVGLLIAEGFLSSEAQ
jgi:hypothetical protein